MFRYLKKLVPQWYLLVLLFILICIKVVLDFLNPAVLGAIIAALNNGDKINGTYILCCALMMTAFALLAGFVSILMARLASYLTSTMMAKIRYDVYSKINEFSIDEMNKFSASSLLTRTTNDITIISDTYINIFKYAIYGPLVAIASLIYLISLNNWQMTLMTLGIISLLIFLLIFIIRKVLPQFEKLQTKIDHVNLITKETLEGLRVVRAYNAEKYQEEKFDKVNQELGSTDLNANRAINAIMPLLQIFVGILQVGIVWLGASMVQARKMEYANIAVITQYSILLLTGFILMTVIFVEIPRSLVCSKRINEVLDTNVKVLSGNDNSSANEVGTIEFKNVGYTYPNGDKPALEGISFKAKKGETIAFIGATGSGKTTLLNLLPRFADATQGEVLVDGRNVRSYVLDDLFAKFGYVPQKPYLFHKTLKENVTLGRPNATAEELHDALDISQSLEFVNKLPGGVNYEISQGGKNVSGGQRQRLSIARAIIMKPEIFLFDDSFSALDYQTDKILRGQIKSRCKGATSVIVAQRVGTIIDADQIIVLDNGKMVGHGTHKELLKKCDTYREIALSQLSKEELEND